MTFGELTTDEVRAQAGADGLSVQVGPFVVRLRTEIRELLDAWRFLYADFPLADGDFADFHIQIVPPEGLRRFVAPQAIFLSDGRRPFSPMPRSAALPLLEWGLNWCVASQAHQYLVVHSATVERGGRAILLPAPPNSGKSTLCAGLVHSGWRLLSDEFALVQPHDGDLVPMPRPISLKNAAIEVVSTLFPQAQLGPPARETLKGTVVHVRPPAASVARAQEAASPAWVIFPAYRAGARTEIKPFSKARALVALVDNAFNYGVLDRLGFETLARLVDGAACFELTYGDLTEALRLIGTLDAGGSGRAVGRPRREPPAAASVRTSRSGAGPSRVATNLVLAALRQPEMTRTLGLADWDLLVRQARRAFVLARLATRLADLDLLGPVPAQARLHLEAACGMALQDQQVARWEVDRIRRALAPTGVPLTLLKGAAYLMAELPIARGRRFSDIDILVPKTALTQVEAALRQHGWHVAKLDPYDQRYYRRWMHELPPLQHRQRWTIVDVHHTILPESGRLHPDPRRLLETARSLDGSGVRVLAPAHLILHSAAHLFQDGDMQGDLGNLLDLDGLLRHHGARDGFWRELATEAERLQLGRPLFYAFRYTAKLLDTPIPAEAVAGAGGGRPAWPLLAVMDRLVPLALVPEHPDHPERAVDVSRSLLYARSHWLRMPPLLLARHLLRKSFPRSSAPASTD